MRALFHGTGQPGCRAGRVRRSEQGRRAVFEVDEALEQNYGQLMTEGPAEETLQRQPAIMASGRRRAIDLRSREGQFVANHGLGEYSALCAAGTFDLATTTACLLKKRGQAMQAAVPVGEGAMAALLGADLAIAQAVCETDAGSGLHRRE